MNNIIVAITATRVFPEYLPKGKLPKSMVSDINHRVADLFTARLGGVVLGVSDTLVISAFLGLAPLAIYQNYYYVVTSVTGIIGVIFTACLAGIGDSLISKSKEEVFEDFRTYTFLVSWIIEVCACCMMGLYQPFMEVWVGQEYMLSLSAVIGFCLYFYVNNTNLILSSYKDAGGIWHQDRFRPLLTAIANLTLNIVLVQVFGIYAVILSTPTAQLLIAIPWLLINLFTYIFDRKNLARYLMSLILYAATAFIACAACYLVCTIVDIDLIPGLAVRLVICGVLSNVVFLLFHGRKDEFRDSVRRLKGVLHLEK